MSYYQIILKILEIADRSPELLDFYWPQLIHIHSLESARRTPSSLMKLGKRLPLIIMIQKCYSLMLIASY
jgi:hypothetical protein